MAKANSRCGQSFAFIKNTGQGNFVIGRFHTRARNGCTDAPSPTDTLSPTFSDGVRRLFTGSLKRIIHLQTVRPD